MKAANGKEPIPLAGEELTAKMQSEFTVSEDTDTKHRVWALLSVCGDRGLDPESKKDMYTVTTKDIEKHRESWLRLSA